jgi:hypothetical protein
VSKNPPVTEDQIRQSAAAEAEAHPAQASRNSQLDYMTAEQRQQQTAATLEAILGYEEDRFKAAASKIEDSAHRAIKEQDRRSGCDGFLDQEESLLEESHRQVAALMKDLSRSETPHNREGAARLPACQLPTGSSRA